ncbi:MAG TPA: c-type cytochrome [Usitatibacter sp.]|nr:c-type cytochrome [Usitatibacter sp.]
MAQPAPLAEKVKACEACHGPGGNSAMANTPSIAAQPVLFLENQLVYFREGLRNAPVMQEVAKGMKDEDITALARHFGAQKAKVVAPSAGDKAMLERGKALAGAQHCGQCHLPKYEGRDQMPRLAAQREDYLLEAMIGYRDGKRTGADTTMTEVLYGMSDADIKALAHYLARID